MNDFGRSIIRTFVPLIVGAIVGWFATHNIKVDEATVLPIVDTVVAAGYYAIARTLEHRWPSMGWLLGSRGAPSYANTSIPTSLITPVPVPAGLEPNAVPATIPVPHGDAVEPAVD